uniref:DUF2924 domain-containing protein n=1 Tax=Phenylobacterium glaciei TaxID=2803784 RepID=A0A974P7J4_9CAUL|nr:DUF2924 domain-containing protein [Phenylobacterium glaciei]
MKPQTIARLEALGEALDGGKPEKRKIPAASRLITGTQLIREYQGVPHTVIVRDTDFVYEGALQIPLRHRARDHRHAVERADVLWPQAQG